MLPMVHSVKLWHISTSLAWDVHRPRLSSRPRDFACGRTAHGRAAYGCEDAQLQVPNQALKHRALCDAMHLILFLYHDRKNSMSELQFIRQGHKSTSELEPGVLENDCSPLPRITRQTSEIT